MPNTQATQATTDPLQTSAQDIQAASGTAPGQPTPQVQAADTQQHIKSLNEVEAQITGAPSKPVSEYDGPIYQPHQINMQNWDNIDALRKAAKAGGLDTKYLSDEYLEDVKQRYAHANNPDVVDKVRFFVGASGVTHFMQGFADRKSAMNVLDPASGPARMTDPTVAEQEKADEFFNKNIQTRIIDKGQYISPDGSNYNPPTSYKAGDLLAQALTPKHIAVAAAGTAATVVLARMGLAGLAGGVALYQRFATMYPEAAHLVRALAQGTAFGAAMNHYSGGGPAP